MFRIPQCPEEESERLIKYVRSDSVVSESQEAPEKHNFKLFERENVDQVALRHLPRNTEFITCPTCFNCVEPKVRHRKEPWTYYLSIMLCPLLLCWIPYLSGCMKAKLYYCPNCKMSLGQSDVFEKKKVIDGFG